MSAMKSLLLALSIGIVLLAIFVEEAEGQTAG